MRATTTLTLAGALFCLGALPSAAAPVKVPTIRGECVPTTFQHLSYRSDTPVAGDMVLFANGIWNYTADGVIDKELEASVAGDPVELCLANPPDNCEGIKTGRFFAAINLRTQHFTLLPEQPEACAGG